MLSILIGVICFFQMLRPYLNNDSIVQYDLLQMFKDQDQKHKNILESLNVTSLSEDVAMKTFYTYLNFPLQSVCRVLKRVGGEWIEARGKGVDGDKFICLDNIKFGVGNCLIYSFGIANTWVFEDFFDRAGCDVYAYDHTIAFNHDTRGDSIRYFKKGLGVGKDLLRLSDIIKSNHHQEKIIDYLKIDIEYHELDTDGGLEDWIESGALENVNQVALELHLDRIHKPQPTRFIWLLDNFKKLHQMNFRLISYQVNQAMGPLEDHFYNFIEIVLMKERD